MGGKQHVHPSLNPVDPYDDIRLNFIGSKKCIQFSCSMLSTHAASSLLALKTELRGNSSGSSGTVDSSDLYDMQHGLDPASPHLYGSPDSAAGVTNHPPCAKDEEAACEPRSLILRSWVWGSAPCGYPAWEGVRCNQVGATRIALDCS